MGYCGLVEQIDLVYNLWWCMSGDFKRAATDDGMDKPEYNTKVLFLARLNEMTIKGQNIIVGHVNF